MKILKFCFLSLEQFNLFRIFLVSLSGLFLIYQCTEELQESPEQFLVPHNSQRLKLYRIYFILCGNLEEKPQIITDPDQFLTVLYNNMEAKETESYKHGMGPSHSLKFKG